MGQTVGIEFIAKTGQAQRELERFGKSVSKIAQVWESAMGGKGSRQAGQNLQQLSRGIADLGKAADRSTLRLKAVNDTLDQVVKKRKALEGVQGAVALRDRDAYKGLTDQEKSLSRQHRTWSTIAAIRSQMARNSGLSPGAGGQFFNPNGQPNQAAGGGGGLSRFGGQLGQVAGAAGAVGGALLAGIGAAIAGVAVAAIRESVGTQTEATDFIASQRPGTLRGTNAFGLTGRMRAIGAPLGYNQRESIAVFKAMSEGGGTLGHGLDRDARTAMQMGRMFGVDAGGEASALASAQRSGAFKSGDAKRFAGMLAQEIKRTGLSPRFEEVQQATLTLLNRQTQELGTAKPGPIMALQTLFNKTGIAGLQGMNGANVINQIQSAVTNPQSEGSEALNLAVFRKMGAKSLYQAHYLQEEGLNNPKYLPSLFKMVESSAPNSQLADETLKSHTGMSLHLLQSLRGKFGGKLSNISTGTLKDFEKMLGSGAGGVEKGAAGAGELPGNVLRKAEAHLQKILGEIGDKITPKIIKFVEYADQQLTKLENIGQSTHNTAEKVGLMADLMMKQMGIDPASGLGKGIHGAATTLGGLGDQSTLGGRMAHRAIFGVLSHGQPPVLPEVGTKWHHDMYLPDGTRAGAGVHFAGMGAAPIHSLGLALAEMHAAGLHPRVTDAFRTRAMQASRYRAHLSGRSRYPAARPGHSAHERGEAVDLGVGAGERAAVNQIMAGHGFANNVPGDPVHYNYTIHVHDHTSESRGKQMVKDAIAEHHHHTVHARPNSRNARL